MKKLIFLLLIFSSFTACKLYAQDTLPKFSLNNVGNNRIIVSWTNTLADVKQISIQRSFDSLSGFKTILTVLDPDLPQNGFVDMTATNDHMFYRLYIQQERGMYQFSNTKKPVKDTTNGLFNTMYPGGFPGSDPDGKPNSIYPKNQPPGFIPSLHVYTYRDGNVNINLPDEEKPKKYSIKFFDEEGEFLFELKDIKEKNFKIDKANFFHAGWFTFELSEDGKLIEKHKFYLEKDF
ncbi:MAG: hypothetical protein ABIP79_14050 [Chitinophagaceae bacterium]